MVHMTHKFRILDSNKNLVRLSDHLGGAKRQAKNLSKKEPTQTFIIVQSNNYVAVATFHNGTEIEGSLTPLQISDLKQCR